MPWLEPDVCDHIRALAGRGVRDVVMSPIGFVSDHMEILFDLDVEAREAAEQSGVNLVRAQTAGTHPAFVTMIRELIQERLDPAVTRRSLGTYGPGPDVCQPGCCLIR
jgi:protoporphyrin/coproporphyrin ferrochelatase